MEWMATPFLSATLWVMTLVQPKSDAINVSVGVSPWLVPPRSGGSSIVARTSRTVTSVRECEAQLPLSRIVTTVLCVTVTMHFLR
jgi:hypothetical protein